MDLQPKTWEKSADNPALLILIVVLNISGCVQALRVLSGMVTVHLDTLLPECLSSWRCHPSIVAGLFRARLEEVLPSDGLPQGFTAAVSVTLMCLEALPSAAWLRQPGEVTATKRNSAEAIAELLSHAAMDERSRTANPNAAATDTLSLSVKFLWCPGKKEKKKKNPDSKVTHVHRSSVSCGNAVARVWAPAGCVGYNFCLIRSGN